MAKKGIYRPFVVCDFHDAVPVCFTSYVHPYIKDEYYRKLLEYSFELETILMLEYGL